MDQATSETTTSRGSLTRATQRLRSADKPSLIATLGGIASFVAALRALRRGDRRRGLLGLLLSGALFLTVVWQRSREQSGDDRAGVDSPDSGETSTDVTDDEPSPRPERDRPSAVTDQTLEVDEPDVDEADVDESDTDESDADDQPSPRPERDEPSAVTDQTFEIGDADVDDAEGPEQETATTGSRSDVPEQESYERLGEAAFNEHSNEVPVPQRIFNTGLLALDAEVFWGVRESDEAVLVSQQYDQLEERDGVRYVGSSQIDGERTLSIPGVVVNHWNDVAGGSTAVPSGTDLVFVTSDDLQEDGQVLVVPEQWSDDVLSSSIRDIVYRQE